MMLFLLLFYGIFALGVNIFLLECSAEPGRAKAKAGSSAPWVSEGWRSLGIWRCLKRRCDCTRPIGASRCSSMSW